MSAAVVVSMALAAGLLVAAALLVVAAGGARSSWGTALLLAMGALLGASAAAALGAATPAMTLALAGATLAGGTMLAAAGFERGARWRGAAIVGPLVAGLLFAALGASIGWLAAPHGLAAASPVTPALGPVTSVLVSAAALAVGLAAAALLGLGERAMKATPAAEARETTAAHSISALGIARTIAPVVLVLAAAQFVPTIGAGGIVAGLLLLAAAWTHAVAFGPAATQALLPMAILRAFAGSGFALCLGAFLIALAAPRPWVSAVFDLGLALSLFGSGALALLMASGRVSPLPEEPR